MNKMAIYLFLVIPGINAQIYRADSPLIDLPEMAVPPALIPSQFERIHFEEPLERRISVTPIIHTPFAQMPPPLSNNQKLPTKLVSVSVTR